MNTKAVKKKAPVKKAAPKKKAPVKKPSTSKKKAPKPPVKKQRARQRRLGPIPKYHINHRDWDKVAVMDALCEEIISSSYSLVTLCRNNADLPSAKAILRWMNEEARGGGSHPLCDQYARAKEMQADYLADEMFDIADDGRNDYMDKLLPNGETVSVLNSEHVQRSRLRIDTRKWVASKLKPKKYGDKLELTGDPERPLSSLGDEELSSKIAALTKMLQEAGAL